MPPRKSDVSKVATGDEGTPAKDQGVRDGINIEDLNLPKSIVTRLAKGVLPPNTQIQGNAMLAMTKSATVFVNYLASHANEYAQSENRKTLGPQDVFRALENLEFPDFKPRLEAELAKFNEVQTDKRNTYRSRIAANKASGKTENKLIGEGDENELEDDVEGQLDRDGQPAAKKARRGHDDGTGEISDMNESHNVGDHTADEGEEEDDGQGDDPDDEEEEEDQDEGLEAEEQLDDVQQGEAEDEALDNGEDSDG